MGENVIRIEIVMAPIEITNYESIDTVTLKRRGRKLRPKGAEVEGKWYLQPHLITLGNEVTHPQPYLSPFWPHRRVFIGVLISLSTSDLVDDLDALKSKRKSLPTVILVMEYLISLQHAPPPTLDHYNFHYKITLIWVIEITPYGCV
jgi:hypothetical protein